MRTWIIAATTLVLAGTALAAQETAHFGLALNLCAPAGGFSENTYTYNQRLAKNTYDPTLGVQFLASFPVDRTLAFRLNLGGATFTGHSDLVDYPRIKTRDSLFSLGAEAQVFLGNGNAQRHIGTYLIGGLSMDLERFSGGENLDDYDYDYGYGYSHDGESNFNRCRMGGVVGIGHSFRYAGRMRWVVEGVYHKTLTGTGQDVTESANSGYAPNADFFKFSFGIMF